jgi:hypothetical protein
MRDPAVRLCHGCETEPIRATGEYVTKIEAWTDQRIYCEACAKRWESGDNDASDETQHERESA